MIATSRDDSTNVRKRQDPRTCSYVHELLVRWPAARGLECVVRIDHVGRAMSSGAVLCDPERLNSSAAQLKCFDIVRRAENNCLSDVASVMKKDSVGSHEIYVPEVWSSCKYLPFSSFSKVFTNRFLQEAVF